MQTLPLQTYWTISQNYRQSKTKTLLVVTGWFTCHTFCSFYGFYYIILQHIHVSAAVIHLHTRKRAMRGKGRKLSKECLNINHHWSRFTFKHTAGPHLKLGLLRLRHSLEKNSKQGLKWEIQILCRYIGSHWALQTSLVWRANSGRDFSHFGMWLECLCGLKKRQLLLCRMGAALVSNKT